MTLAANLAEQTRTLALVPDGDDDPYTLDPGIDPLHEAVCVALTAPVEEVAALAGAEFPLAVLLDPFACPSWALGFCALIYGTTLQPGLTEAEQRVFIDSTQGWRRGTDEALIAAVKLTLTGTRHVTLDRRTNPAAPGVDSPGHKVITVRDEECPDPDRTAAFAERAKLYSHIVHLVVVTGQTWGEAQAADTRTWAQLLTYFPTTTWAQAQSTDIEV